MNCRFGVAIFTLGRAERGLLIEVGECVDSGSDINRSATKIDLPLDHGKRGTLHLDATCKWTPQ